ncbi:hypothetical protein GCM10022197_34610 [Microlunatus spumicola]|uniref:DUF1707 domain-containing protein n=1 Tax=Microlunatus spumicola TaxID=81499 RepID=A0ABP6XZ15_9ACTN
MDPFLTTAPDPDRGPAHLPSRPVRPLVAVGPEPAFRVGDVERAAACDALAEHFAAGRLDPAELEDRLGRAMAARTQSDLRVLFRDLQPRRAVPPAPRPTEAGEVVVERGGARAAVPFLASLLVLSLMLAGGMLMVLGTYNGALLVAALIGGTATALAGGCVTAIGQATLRRR